MSPFRKSLQKLLSKLAISLTITTFFCQSFPLLALAQETPTNKPETSIEQPTETATTTTDSQVKITAKIKSLDKIQIDKSLVLDASDSISTRSPGETSYKWDFGDGNQQEGIEVVHSYKDPGTYTLRLTVSTTSESHTITKEVFAFRKSIILISDKQENKNRIEGLINDAKEKGVYIELVSEFKKSSEALSLGELTDKLTKQTTVIDQSNQIIIWTDNNNGIYALAGALQQFDDTERKIDFSKKSILIIQDIPNSNNEIRRQYQLLQPEVIIIGRESAIQQYIDAKDTTEIINKLQKGNYNFTTIDANSQDIHFYNFMSYFVNYLVDNKIPMSSIILILLLPIIATVIAFMKQVIGISTLGVYTPTILTLTFWFLGLQFGLTTFLILLTIGGITRHILKKFRILFIPKMAIVLTLVSLTLFAILTLSIAVTSFDHDFFSPTTIFALIIMSTLTEKFVSVQNEKGLRSAILIMAKTIFVSIIALLIIGGKINLMLFEIEWPLVRNIIQNYPETIFIVIIANVFLGKWAGLRLLEYFRFREVFRHIEE